MMKRTSMQRGFTLIELIASMVVLGVVASVSAPLIGAASDSFVTSANNRDDIERLAHAMDRSVRLLREVPATAAGSGLPDIVVAATDNIEFADGAELELVGTTLMLTPAGGAASPLCTGVTAFELAYLAEDGLTDTIATPQTSQRIEIRIVAGGHELRSSVFFRVAMGSPAP